MSLLGVSCWKMHCHLKGNDDDAKKVSHKINLASNKNEANYTTKQLKIG